MISYLVVFGATALTALVATPVVRRVSILVGAIDRPSDRKVHPKPTPTLGGVAIFIAVLVGMAVSHSLPYFGKLFQSSSEPLAALVGGLVVVLLGTVDDVRGTSAPVKLSGQILAAGLVVLFGVQLVYFWFPGQGILSLGSDLGVPLTILWVVAMMNAINLIDGLDGLAPGLTAIAAIAFFAYMFLSPSLYGQASPAALLSAITAGGVIGFLPWNFHPAKIFMGDSGSMLLGLLLATATISGVGRNPSPPSGGDLAAYSIPVLVPLVVLALPFLDVVLAIVRRMRRGRRVMAPDKEHIHHRLLDFGHSHRQAVLLMYLWSALISGSALAVALVNGRLVVGAIGGGALLIIAATAIPRMWGRAGRHARRRRPVAVAAGPVQEPVVSPVPAPLEPKDHRV
ncbi:MAG: undecaprenyl/decaprenyl-phosphate alpha-N-acetylglucosaminyl 1-phosphate transferase [Actinomycetota bacterium]|nr:undecaprenyl/decaprenyl-phosphate alpha-N-acetylglucosaminyl 1-phosphate transferase [Actinomycetota bacterium]